MVEFSPDADFPSGVFLADFWLAGDAEAGACTVCAQVAPVIMKAAAIMKTTNKKT